MGRVKEFQIIAQELTYYGVDLYGHRRIAELIERMARIPGVEWIRLHYAYPNRFPMELLRVIREHKNVCKYLDIALQHVSDHMLSRMKRHITKQETLDLVAAFRREVLICFSGKTDHECGAEGDARDFAELMDFVRTARFDRMGAFAYSEEEGTYAADNYEDDVPAEVKQARLDRLMALQEEISAELLAEKVGQTFRIVVDRKEGDYYIGRTEYDSPEVDCEVLSRATDRPLEIGSFDNAKVTSA